MEQALKQGELIKEALKVSGVAIRMELEWEKLESRQKQLGVNICPAWDGGLSPVV